MGCCGRKRRRRVTEKNGHSLPHKALNGLNGYRPTDKEPFMNERQREYFRAKLQMWKEEILQGGARHAAASPGREPESPRSRRPRLVGDRPRDRAARARPPAQADRQDRRRDPAHRRRHLRLLRGDRRADRAQAPRGAPDRDAVDRGAGAPRAARAGLSRRLGFAPPTEFRRAGKAKACPPFRLGDACVSSETTRGLRRGEPEAAVGRRSVAREGAAGSSSLGKLRTAAARRAPAGRSAAAARR